MISERHQFIFVHVPKTAGNSVQNVLKAYSEDTIIATLQHQDGVERFSTANKKFSTSKHSFLSRYESRLPADLYHSFFKFATIRNPWDRMVSLYFSPAQGRTEWNRHEFLTLINGAVAVRDFICTTHEHLDQDIDFLMRFETLNNDFRTVCDKLGIPHSPLPKRNKSNRTHYSAYYDHDTKHLVQQRFQDEITFGGYEFENS